MLYGKLENGVLKIAPETYEFSNGMIVTNFNNDIALLTELGYKEIIKDTTPLDTRFEYLEEYSLTPDDKILISYVLDTSEKVLSELKEKRIQKTKDDLAIYLEENPITSSCKNGVEKLYTVTMEKQNLLTSTIMDYLSKALFNITEFISSSEYLNYMDSLNIPIYWNAKGEVCEIWKYSEIYTLKNEIMDYVLPIVEYQRYLEEQINEQTSQDGIYALDCYFNKDKIDTFIKNKNAQLNESI